jgi:hypothetical protein
MRSAILVLAVLLSGCGTLGKLDVDASRRTQLGALDRVVVGEFVANDTRRSRDAEQGAKRAEAIEAGRVAFARRIAEELRAVGAYDAVLEAAAEPPALMISGTIDRWEPGNIAARTLVGFVGKSEFEATVRFTDLGTGAELARLKVDRNSWPLPIGSASNVVQTVEFHMQQAARRVARELARARGVEVPDPDRTASPP